MAVTIMLALSACGEKKEEASSEAAAGRHQRSSDRRPAKRPRPHQRSRQSAATREPRAAPAGGSLNIYNWGNYTNPKLIEKFEKEFNVKVTVTDYDSNDVALAKVQSRWPWLRHRRAERQLSCDIFIKEGLLLETKPNEMPNFKNMDPQWVDVAFDKGRNYTVPWQWGTTGV